MPELIPLHPDNANLVNALYCAHFSAACYENVPENYPRFGDLQLENVQTFAEGAIFGLVARTGSQLLLGFRGTSEVQHWLTNLNAVQVPGFGGAVHAGFATAMLSVADKADNLIRLLQKPGDTLWITGHSLGGALATLAAKFFADFVPTLGGVFTFGQPRVGNNVFFDNYPTAFTLSRFVNNRDVVPHMPPRIAGFFTYYKHVGKFHGFDKNGKLTRADRAWSRMVKAAATFSMTREEATMEAMELGFLEDHRIASYIARLETVVG
jgi:triacylglycerol lipase